MAEPFGSGNGVESLEQRYRHLDDRVGRLGQEVAGISATLGQVSHMLETISRRVNEPQRTQWSAIIAACAFVASLGYSSLAPVKDGVHVLAGRLDAVQNRQREVAELEGAVRSRMELSDTEHERANRYIDMLGLRTREIDRQVAKTEARIDALEAKVRDVDMAGSRKWLGKEH